MLSLLPRLGFPSQPAVSGSGPQHFTTVSSKVGSGLVFAIPKGQVSVLFLFDFSQTLDTLLLSLKFSIHPTPFNSGFSPPSGLFLLGPHPPLRVGGCSRQGPQPPTHSPRRCGQCLVSHRSKAMSSVQLHAPSPAAPLCALTACAPISGHEVCLLYTSDAADDWLVV